MECPAEIAGHSALMPANLITFAHRSVSSATSLRNSAGDIIKHRAAHVFQPSLDRRDRRVQALTSRLSRSMISFGVLAEARRFRTNRPPT